jgi:hypothetical protein
MKPTPAALAAIERLDHQAYLALAPHIPCKALRLHRQRARVRALAETYYAPTGAPLLRNGVLRNQAAKKASAAAIYRHLEDRSYVVDARHRAVLAEIVAENGGTPPSERSILRWL